MVLKTSRPLRIVFVGTRPIAAECLTCLHQNPVLRVRPFHIVGVLSLPKTIRKWWSIEGEHVWQVAIRHNLPLITYSDLRGLDYDILICMFYHKIFPAEVLAQANLYNVNFHTAPLPEFRGCHAYSHAIINGDRHFGTSCHLMSEGIDEGDVIRVRRFSINSDETARSLYEKTMDETKKMFHEIIPSIMTGDFVVTPQSELAKLEGCTPRYYDDLSLERIKLREIDSPSIAKETLSRAFDFRPYLSNTWIK